MFLMVNNSLLTNSVCPAVTRISRTAVLEVAVEEVVAVGSDLGVSVGGVVAED